MSAIGVIATLRVQSGKVDEFVGVFAELAAAVNANETGNQAALDAHRASDHFRSIGARLGPCLAGAPEIETLSAA